MVHVYTLKDGIVQIHFTDYIVITTISYLS